MPSRGSQQSKGFAGILLIGHLRTVFYIKNNEQFHAKLSELTIAASLEFSVSLSVLMAGFIFLVACYLIAVMKRRGDIFNISHCGCSLLSMGLNT